MLSHHGFHKMRLKEFLPEEQLTSLENWEFDGRTWVGEASGFTEWLRPENAPDRLESISLHLEELHANVATEIFQRLGLDLAFGMTLNEVSDQLGRPAWKHSFTLDRDTYDFQLERGDKYRIACTIHCEHGLIHVVVSIVP